ncbi:LppP/LprE lipoprotein [Frankia sp. EI5c]|uniref:LppP/LprE family lipoprotein n=1 Tax=Frankia sp. EI5c TaxID=683316 RepID=UPI0007C2D080|nr:LppP/LprE family lipoprotein [Frankia sp. EI5c]OAA23873.1 LppP/LprE lipoprotein [Frankia sp. EI5c]
MRRTVLILILAATAGLAGTAAVTAPALAAPTSAALPSAPSAPAGGSSSTAALTLAQASRLVRDRGYTPLTTGGYEPTHDLSVIVGRLSTSVDGHPQQAFFFHRGRFVGTDTTASANVRWVWSTGDVVALQYDLYRPDDPMCCPSAGASTVRFRWDGSAVVPLDPIPTNSWSAPKSRR